ncbi:hypothetical protein F5B18DRAFT_644539 [Nemania serpens]|nr:hypothetical protein F5B18DRAFT_644539 [Nemania serpens]
MHIISSIASCFIVIPLAHSLPQKHQPKHEFQITALNGKFPVNGPYGTGPIQSSLSVTITYPGSSKGGAALTTTCDHSWPASTHPGATDWTACQNSSVQWRLPAAGFSCSAGFHATQDLTQNPGASNDPNAFLSCLQMGKMSPEVCQLNGPLSAHAGPVVMIGHKTTTRPS